MHTGIAARRSPYYPPTRRAVPNQRLSARFRRPRLLIVGCGDVGLRLAAWIHARFGDRLRVFAATREPQRQQRLRGWNAVPLPVDLDRRDGRARLAGLARWVVHLAPPPASGPGDPRSAATLARLIRPIRAGLPQRERQRRSLAERVRTRPQRWVYVSTTGVYGDAGGARFDETRPPAPGTPRGARRLAAERLWRGTARRHGARLSILRAPGLYASDRLPRERLERGTPALIPAHDVFTNHVNADDLATLCLTALWRGRPNRVYHAVDDNEMKMGDYFDRVADALGLPRPPRLSRDAIAGVVSAANLSFMRESRRLDNRRLHVELRHRLRFPTLDDTLAALPPRDATATVDATVHVPDTPPGTAR